MKLLVFTVYDSAVSAYLQPFFARTSGEAIRSFSDACREGPFAQHPMDFTLMLLGEYDDAGAMFATQAPVRVASATEFSTKMLDAAKGSA
ncbi:MAG: nonstructural protein [Microviridae sp.]|nr:MAG: nonstructural protein [Microviridae sp.]